MLEIIKTADGSHTIFVSELNEHYHSVNGAFRESSFIFINNGFDFNKAESLRIFEVGFGTGLNTFLSAIRSKKENRRVYYTAIEKYPLPDDIIQALNYPDFVDKNDRMIFRAIHDSPWNSPQKIHSNFTLTKTRGDLITDDISGNFDIIYFDAFGPDKQPEMWTGEIFRKISEIVTIKGILVTFTSKGEVKRRLREFGFQVDILPGPPGKRHIIRAVKI
jgi:tRNA U34 5-methylaminomethyl-2-thiouridine-forming methyltransferase MnmC